MTVLLPCAWSAAVMLRAVARYWHDTHGRLRDLADWPALRRALRYALRLRYLRGGGGDCYYPGEDPSPARRRFHAAVFYRFGACLAATLTAACMQDILGDAPPYPLLSAPVVLGTAGGLGLLALTGLLTLLLRATPAYGLILVAHLATIVVCFCIAPYTTFVHFVYRFLAIVADNLESGGRGAGPG